MRRLPTAPGSLGRGQPVRLLARGHGRVRSAPWVGVGAGDYQPGYYLHRRTTESIQQPHSLELQTLAELGVIGALLLAASLGPVAVGLVRTAREARGDPLARAVVVAAGGAFVGWLCQTSVDWLHLFPGLTAVALAAAVALRVRPEGRPERSVGLRHGAVMLATAAVTIAGALTIAPRMLSLYSQASAQSALAAARPPPSRATGSPGRCSEICSPVGATAWPRTRPTRTLWPLIPSSQVCQQRSQ